MNGWHRTVGVGLASVLLLHGCSGAGEQAEDERQAPDEGTSVGVGADPVSDSERADDPPMRDADGDNDGAADRTQPGDESPPDADRVSMDTTPVSREESGGATAREETVDVDPADCESLPLRNLEAWVPPYHRMDVIVGQERNLWAFATADAFREWADAEPPESIDFETEWAVVHRSTARGPVKFDAIRHCPPERQVRVGIAEHGLAESCERPIHVRRWGTFALAAVEAGPDAPLGKHAFDGGRELPEIGCDVSDAGGGDPCSLSVTCKPELTCVGLTRSHEGVCGAAWRFGRYDVREAREIPDDDPDGIELERTVSGLDGIDADVILNARLRHPSIDDVEIALVNPSGRRLTICERGSCPAELDRVPRGLEGEPVDGDWTLHVIDHGAGNVGQVEAWSLAIAAVPGPPPPVSESE